MPAATSSSFISPIALALAFASFSIFFFDWENACMSTMATIANILQFSCFASWPFLLARFFVLLPLVSVSAAASRFAFRHGDELVKGLLPSVCFVVFPDKKSTGRGAGGVDLSCLSAVACSAENMQLSVHPTAEPPLSQPAGQPALTCRSPPLPFQHTSRTALL